MTALTARRYGAAGERVGRGSLATAVVVPGGARAVDATLRARLVAAAGSEPEGLRAELGVLARDDPAGGADRVARRLASEIGARWRTVVAPAGPAADALVRTACGARRETWLWAMGERTWDHTVEVLAGRYVRRLAAEGSAHLCA